MRVLVTGGAGFIGSHVADAYRAAGHEVVVVDDLSTGRRENLDPSVPFYRMRVGDPELGEVFARHRFEAVSHHAAQIDVRLSVADPLRDARVNVLEGIALLEQCRRHGVRKVVYAATGGALYGNPHPEDLPVSEVAPVRPASPYGASKYALEVYLRLYRDLHGLDFTALRYANVYGPRQDPLGEAGVVAIFTDRLLAGRRPVVYGDGLQTRDYVYVEDVCRANLLALEAGSGESLNIGTGEETSVLELLEALQQAAGTRKTPEFAPPRPGEVHRIALDPGRARHVLGWQPQVPLAEGLRRTMEWHRASRPRTRGTPLAEPG